MRFLVQLSLIVGFMLAYISSMQSAHALETQTPDDNENLRPEEVLVIANEASDDSMALARYYMKKRNIPQKNLFTVDFPNQKHRRPISHKSFQEKIVKPLQQFLEKTELKEKILLLLTLYDVPYKVAGPSALAPKLKRNITKYQNKLKEKLADPNANTKKIHHLRERIEKSKTELKKIEPIWDALLAQQHASARKRAAQVLANHASLDSELAWLFRRDVYGASATKSTRLKAYFGRTANPYFSQGMKFRAFRKRSKAAGLLEQNGMIYLSARLEGPSLEISKNLVDLAIQAEKNGPAGIGCFDARRSTIGQTKSGNALGETWVRRAYIETHNAGFQTIFDEKKTLFEKGACPNTLFYWGWYALQNYQDVFESHFAAGAFAVHTASGEASDIRHFNPDKKNPWCAGLLAHGVAFCSGPISEPFLDAFPHADLFYPKLFQGWSAGEAYWASQSYLSWMMVMIGDPLYTPFSGKNSRTHYTAGRIELREVGEKSAPAFLSKNKQYDVLLLLKATSSIFKSPAHYKITHFKTNQDKHFHLKALDNIKTRIIDNKQFLILSGMAFETGDFNQQRGLELEIKIDLGRDGGEKILSQRFQLH